MVKIGGFVWRRHFAASDWLAAALTIMMLAWLVIPSRLFLQPASYSIDGEFVLFTRSVPYGQVWATWTTEIRAQGKECGVSGGPSVYQVATHPGELDEIRYFINPVLVPCIQAGRFDLSQTHTVLLFGVIPLRATESVWRCQGNDGTPCLRIL